MYKVKIFVFVVAVSFVLSSCQSTGLTKKKLGAVTGGVLGGLAGYTISDGKNKKLFAIGGAVAGAWLGSKIGEHLDMIGEPYLVTKTSNVRGGPGKDYKVVDVVNKDTTVDVIGQVQGQPWMLIGFNNTGSGFIHSSLVQTVPVEQRKTEIESTETQSAETVEQTVEVKRTCKTVKQVIILEDGSEKVEEITACQSPNGWETI